MIGAEFFRFLIAGATVNAGDFGIYYVLFHFLPFTVAKGISFSCAATAGYFLSKHWIFKSQHLSYAEAVRYAAANILALGVNVLINHGVLSFWPEHVLRALIIATAATGLFTFAIYKWWVFPSTANSGSHSQPRQ